MAKDGYGVTLYDINDGKRKSLGAVVMRFKRLDWGAWIRFKHILLLNNRVLTHPHPHTHHTKMHTTQCQLVQLTLFSQAKGWASQKALEEKHEAAGGE